MIKLLIIKNSYNDHLVRFLTHLKNVMPDSEIDFLAPKEVGNPPVSIQGIVRHFYTFDDLPSNNLLKKIFLKYRLHKITSLRKVVRQIIKENRYDSITIHYPMWHYLSAMSLLKKSSENILLFPWGSDVYRATWYEKIVLRKLYKKAKYVGSQDNRFRKEFCNILNVEKTKLVDLNIGSDMVDYIRQNLSKLSKEEAKKQLGVREKYVITCGYNNQSSQRHHEMIDSVAAVKEKLPYNLILFFPVTYGGTRQYTKDIECHVQNVGLDSRFFDKYLPESEFFKLMRATDIFIHVQTTDADSGSVKEFLLSGAKVLNGSWLKYDDLLKYEPKPYFEVETLEDLKNNIVNAAVSDSISVNQQTTDLLNEFGWEHAIKAWKRFYESLMNNQ